MMLVKENFWTIPNLISILRIVFVPYFAYLIYINKVKEASVVFLIMAVSDFFDGYLARKLNQISRLGKILDPLADKLAIIVAIFIVGVFSSNYYVPEYFVIIILLKESYILVGIAVLFMFRRKLVVNTYFIGKVTMFLEYLAVVIYLINAYFSIPFIIINTVYILTSISAVLSIIIYTLKN
ncbi:MAG: CDP-alcohol phosphatidyltransferase family protein [Deferribacterales bacterium]